MKSQSLPVPMWLSAFLAYPALASSHEENNSLQARYVSGTANVYFSNSTGSDLSHYASGFIYGIPDTADQIPSDFYTSIGFTGTRTGGAQLPEQGWSTGSADEYAARFASTLSNYQTARQYGGNVILLPHDLWGIEDSSLPYPGDDGDWNLFDEFLTRLITDLVDNDMLEGLTIDIWNEPNGSNFWNRDRSQYLDMWGRAYARFREELPDVPLSGPSASYPPRDDDWWNAWMDFVVVNGSLPDVHSWHALSSSFADTRVNQQIYDDLLEGYGVSRNGAPTCINEYGASREQNPAGAAWWVAQLERAEIYGFRANWASGWELHDYMAQLLGKPGAGTDDYNEFETGYWALSEYWVYQYYGTSMTGYRVQTEPTDDYLGDVYATVGDDGVVRVLAGTRNSSGSWTVKLNDLASLGLADKGTISITTLEFSPAADNNVYSEVAGTVNLGSTDYDYTDGVIELEITNTDVYRTWAFEFTL